MSTVLAVSVILTIWSALTLYLTTHGTREYARWGCVSGLVCQGLWLYFDWITQAFGLMPLAGVFGTLYVRGWARWRT